MIWGNCDDCAADGSCAHTGLPKAFRVANNMCVKLRRETAMNESRGLIKRMEDLDWGERLAQKQIKREKPQSAFAQNNNQKEVDGMTCGRCAHRKVCEFKQEMTREMDSLSAAKDLRSPIVKSVYCREFLNADMVEDDRR